MLHASLVLLMHKRIWVDSYAATQLQLPNLKSFMLLILFSGCVYTKKNMIKKQVHWLPHNFSGPVFHLGDIHNFYYFVLPASNTPMLIGLNIFFCIVHSPLLGDWTNCTVTLRTITVFEYLKIVGLKLFYKYLAIFIKHL